MMRFYVLITIVLATAFSPTETEAYRRTFRPTYRHSRPTYRHSRPTYRHSRPTYRHSRPTYRHPRPTYRHPRPTYRHSRPTYRHPRPTYRHPRSSFFPHPLLYVHPTKPPFSATPLGQRLTPHALVTDNVRTTPTANSPAGGGPGYTRSRGQQFHGGIDDPSSVLFHRTVLVRYTGMMPGIVTAARDAYDTKGHHLGKMVVIRSHTPFGVYESKTLHHAEVFVKEGQMVHPGTEIARGAGIGRQANGPLTGGPHVHWELRRNGVLINPINGFPLKR